MITIMYVHKNCLYLLKLFIAAFTNVCTVKPFINVLAVMADFGGDGGSAQVMADQHR